MCYVLLEYNCVIFRVTLRVMSYLKGVLATPQVARLGYLKDIACLCIRNRISLVYGLIDWVDGYEDVRLNEWDEHLVDGYRN